MALPRSYRDGLTVRPSWFPDWSGDVVAIVAGGESVIPEAVDSLRGRCRVAVINNSYQLAPWADLLYAADGKWWEYHVAARGFSGLKVTPDAAAARRYGLNRVSLVPETAEECARIFLGGDGSIGHGGNGGFQTVNLVTAFGARRQIWIGLDFCGEHWHGKHPDALKNPRPQTLEKWRKRLDGQADELKRLGVEVLNVSSTSALTNYRKCSLPEALASMDVKDDVVNFDAAETFLKEARAAHEAGDLRKSLAARKLIAIALNLVDEPRVRLHTGHLKAT